MTKKNYFLKENEKQRKQKLYKPIKEGFLLKKGKKTLFRQKWRKRFFELNGLKRKLFYYSDDTKEKLLGIIDLKTNFIISTHSFDDEKYGIIINVGFREYHFSSSSEDEQKSWVQWIKKTSSRIRINQDPNQVPITKPINKNKKLHSFNSLGSIVDDQNYRESLNDEKSNDDKISKSTLNNNEVNEKKATYSTLNENQNIEKNPKLSNENEDNDNNKKMVNEKDENKNTDMKNENKNTNPEKSYIKIDFEENITIDDFFQKILIAKQKFEKEKSHQYSLKSGVKVIN
ncbi:sesquipedalian [Anaeramoeba flamelloides]|uniref:Sesquipedalian n=1 Tax=Anaeramoeba flamelloides TaxID=1746091 RepID=A0ABQ8YKF2_9EUKA|nr:sesquipedalian [Anaeramoeba flamelloides]